MERLVESKYLWDCKACGEDCERPHGEHAWVPTFDGPYNAGYVCQWCGESEDDSSCRYAYYSQMPDGFESACAICQRCDDDEREGAGAEQAMMCQLGDCLGMAYDVVFDNVKGDVICLNCFEIRH